ncbi:MAG: PD-(D/E)XK nuclease family protein [Bacteroidales bacterium]|nr:PD-(D/E)XK nuclease family protein [Bacteroidales bacterium]
MKQKKTFLKQVADHYYSQGDISEKCFIFPNRRSMVFFRKFLGEAVARGSSTPLLAPRMMTINDFFSEMADLVTADRITLLLVLYDCYAALNPKAESLDDFIFWGDVLLGDFDDVDKYLIEPEQLFVNVADYKAIQDTFSYLTENQRTALENFVGHFNDRSGRLTVNIDSKNPNVKERFLQIWSLLLPLYHKYNETLREKGLAYEGMVYRSLAKGMENDLPEKIKDSKGDYIFVGLNALNECEKKVLGQLKNAGLAQFCWDWSGDMIKDTENRSSFFMSNNVKDFPQAFDLDEEGFDVPDFNVLGVPSSYGQVKHLRTILSRMDDPSGKDTAVILPDESLLMPLLNSIPESVSDINVTMGYPLSASAVYVLMSDISKMQMHLRKKDSGWFFYHKQVWDVLSNGLFRTLITPDDMAVCREKADSVRKEGKYYIPQEDLNGHPLLDLMFRPVLTDLSSNAPQQIETFADYLQDILSAIAPLMTASQETAIELEAAKVFYTSLNSLKSRKLAVMPPTFVRLVDVMVSGATVPFKGEPLKGMQIMGPLETRALDFRNIVVLSCNEGMFPRRSVSSSFIPPELRKGFKLPTYEYQDAVWAYYFYRMVSRAEKVWLVYDSRTEGLKRGEESRYIKQLRYHYGIDLNLFIADAELASFEKNDDRVVKTDEVMDIIDNMTFSASALQNYVFCPMKFYYQSVLKIKADEDVAESLDNAMIGNVYHNTMRALYYGDEAMMSDVPFEKMEVQPDKGMDEVSVDYLEKWQSEDMHGLISAKVESLMKAELNMDEVRGRDLVVKKVIVRYVLETIRKDMLLLQRSGVRSFRIVGLEKKVAADICGCRFFGVMDRVDSILPGTIRLVDYKSGADSQGVLAVTDESAETVVAKIFDDPYARKKEFKAALQFHIYDRMIRESGLAKDLQLCNSLYSTSELFNGVPTVFPVNGKFERLMDERLEKLLSELKDRDIPFERTKEADACRFCDFKMICGR